MSISFSYSLKNEILENKPLRVRYKKAQAYGLFLFAKSFNAQHVRITTESVEVARLFCLFLQDFLGKDTLLASEEKTRGTGQVFTVKLVQKQDRLRLLELFAQTDGINMDNLRTPAQIHAFLSGAYLACGNMADPQKSYHLEFVVREQELCRQLAALLDSCIPGAKLTTRRNLFLTYYKECAQIEDLMTLMGASKSCLAVIEIEMIKNVRNQANRVTNCETANIDKLVNAAASQLEDIRLILQTMGEETLPAHLREVALLRLQNPDMSLRELVEASPSPISRSGMHHRLDKLSRIAADIRQGVV